MEKQELNSKSFTSEYEVIQLLTETQKETLEKFRKEGTAKFTRNDYQVLATIKKNCRDTIENYQEALKIYVELTK